MFVRASLRRKSNCLYNASFGSFSSSTNHLNKFASRSISSQRNLIVQKSKNESCSISKHHKLANDVEFNQRKIGLFRRSSLFSSHQKRTMSTKIEQNNQSTSNDLIPRSTMFGNDSTFNFSTLLSPFGDLVAYISTSPTSKGLYSLKIQSLKTNFSRTVLTGLIESFWWTSYPNNQQTNMNEQNQTNMNSNKQENFLQLVVKLSSRIATLSIDLDLLELHSTSVHATLINKQQSKQHKSKNRTEPIEIEKVYPRISPSINPTSCFSSSTHLVFETQDHYLNFVELFSGKIARIVSPVAVHFETQGEYSWMANSDLSLIVFLVKSPFDKASMKKKKARKNKKKEVKKRKKERKTRMN